MRVAFFDPAASYSIVPTSLCMLEEFDRVGAGVDVYVRYGGDQLGEMSGAKTHPFPVPFRAWSGDWESTLRQWKWYVKYRGLAGRRVLGSRRYELTIGVNPEGVVAAHRYWQRTGTPFVYLSYEMIFRAELKQKGALLLKAEEVAASRDAAFVIIQDEWRAGLLSEENGIPFARMAFLPVAPRGGPLPGRRNELREKYGIAADKKIVLHAGAYKHFTCGNEITATLPEWPDEFALVVNTPYAEEKNDPFLARLRKVAGHRVYVTRGASSVADLDRMVQSADIGLAFYQPAQDAGKSGFLGRNIQTMGLSSGKLGRFACMGVPVACGGNVAVRELLTQWRFGEYVSTFSELPGCLVKIATWRADYAFEARRFFEERLDFNQFWPAIWRRILGTVGK